MRAAIYARKSTEQHGVADDAKSVARQIDHAREYATRRGWSVVDVFDDDGISGAEFAARPGFVRLLNALKPRAPFDVLVVSELSRLGREQLETGYAVKQLSQADVQIWSYLDDREILLDTPTDKFLMSAVNFAAEIEREKARDRVKDALLRKARAGHVTGGRVFGYDNVPVFDASGRRSHVERRINDAEAAVVRRIFELSAAGEGFTRITKTLNDEGALAPRPQQGRPRAWANSSVREVLLRPLYRGEIVWNQTRKRDRWGVSRASERPASDWLRLSAPDLQVVPSDVWHMAQQQFSVRRRKHDGGPGRRRDIESSYLLSGFARCGKCGGGLAAHSRQHGGQRVFFYGCTSHWKRGAQVCSNNLVGRMDVMDAEVLSTLQDDVCRPAVVEEAIRLALEELRPERRDAERTARETELESVRQECDRLAEAIGKGGPLDALVARLTERQQRREAIEAEIAMLAARTIDLDPKRIEGRLRTKLADWRGLLKRNVTEARNVLRTLLVGPIRFSPVVDDRKRGYAFEGTIALDRLIAGIVDLPTKMASPTETGDGWQMPTKMASPDGRVTGWQLQMRGFSDLKRDAA